MKKSFFSIISILISPGGLAILLFAITIATAIYMLPVYLDSSSAERSESGWELAKDPPPVDKAIHTVQLDNIVFDTFNGDSVPLPEASESLIKKLRDAIIPIYNPRYEEADGGNWLADEDLIIGYVGKDKTFAYPIKMLNLHELVNDEIDGIPLVVTYCPLCASGIIYDRRVKEKNLLFGNTNALYENDMVMFDHQTGSYWFQVGGEAIVGDLTGTRLKLLPSATIPWGQWKKLHPKTRILSRKQNFPGRYDYSRDPFKGYSKSVAIMDFPFPVSTFKINKSLNPEEIVITVRVGDKDKVYPLSKIGDDAINDNVGGVPILLLSQTKGPVGNIFARTVGKRTLTFSLNDLFFTDKETGSNWNFSGKAVSGSLKGTQLQRIASRRAFWFSISIALPDAEIYKPQK